MKEIEDIKIKLKSLGKPRELVYSLINAHRMKHFYINYPTQTSNGNLLMMHDILDYVTTTICGGRADIDLGVSLCTSFDLTIVDTNEDNSIFASYALDAGLIILNSIDQIVFPITTEVLDLSLIHISEPTRPY